MKNLGYLFCLLLTSCQTLVGFGPSAILEDPEIIHEEIKHKEFFLRSEPNQTFSIAESASERPLRALTPPKHSNSSDLIFGMNYSNSPRLQLGLSASTALILLNGLSMNARGMIKYSLLGDPYSSETKQPHLAAIYSHLIVGESNVRGNQRCTFCEGGYPWSGNSKFHGINFGGSYGYRWNDQLMTFVSAAQEFFTTGGTVRQERSVTGDYPAAEVSVDQSAGKSWSIGTGLRFGIKNPLTLNYSYSETEWREKKNLQHFLSVGFSSLDFTKPHPPISPDRAGDSKVIIPEL